MALPLSSKAAVLTAFKQPLEIKDDWPVKQPSELAPGECLIEMEYAACCQSDIHIRDNDWGADASIPLIGGHEGVGRIVAIADHTFGHHIQVGDRVGVKWFAKTCLRCEMCRQGWDGCCPEAMSSAHGLRINGTFAKYVVSFVDYVTPIPAQLDSATATPILCAGLTVYKALKLSNAKVGQWVAISGAGGGLGHLAIQYATIMGFRVIAIDTGEQKKELCLKLGAEKWVDFMESPDIIKDVQAAADGLGPHAAIVAAGHPLPFNQALSYLRSTGTLVAAGMPGGEAMLNVSIALIIAKCLNIVGTLTGNRQDIAEALDIAAQGKVKCVYSIRELSEVNDVMSEMKAGKITGKVLLKV
ncbi:NAD(P)-binding protein [Dendrothele bispora CBS 962.96]|uniref:alcohol dehydrogenase n=1 Tax=Dendrothele bispora (strain CBS 962.96) TaxID=1314807 RepID=A0A4S8M8J0_DENBC|nr:NAD(P)-binding protein [Dendrothele bispora CBS 962.96]